MSGARYTVARGPSGLTPISRARPGERYTCAACGGRLVARLGRIVRHHYAHAPGGGRCNADLALRAAAQELILSGLDAACTSGAAYHLDELCLACGAREPVDIAEPGVYTEPDGRIGDGVSADVAVWHPEAGPLAILITTVNAPVPDAVWRRNAASGTPSVVVEPTWDDVETLARRLTPARTANMDRTSCAVCSGPPNGGDVAAGLRRLDERRSAPPGTWPFTPWHADRYGRPLFWFTRRAIYAGAVVLAEIGFRQAASKPWLFWIELAPGRVVFADYGSTRGAAVWADPSALIYWRFLDSAPAEAASVIQAVLQRCRTAGAAVRLHASYQHLDSDRNTQPDPVAAAAPALLQALLDEDAGGGVRHD